MQPLPLPREVQTAPNRLLAIAPATLWETAGRIATARLNATQLSATEVGRRLTIWLL